MWNMSPWRTHNTGAEWQDKMLTNTERALRMFCVASMFATLAMARVAHAADPSEFLTELITPAGWEARTTHGQPCGWDRELRASTELVTPEGWHDRVTTEPSWSGCMCSELIVPNEWARRGQRSRR